MVEKGSLLSLTYICTYTYIYTYILHTPNFLLLPSLVAYIDTPRAFQRLVAFRIEYSHLKYTDITDTTILQRLESYKWCLNFARNQSAFCAVSVTRYAPES